MQRKTSTVKCSSSSHAEMNYYNYAFQHEKHWKNKPVIYFHYKLQKLLCKKEILALMPY